MPDTLAICLSLAMLYCYMKWIKNQKAAFLIAGVIMASLGCIVKSPYVGVMFLPAAYLYFQKQGIKGLFTFKFAFSFIIPLTVMFLWQRHANYVNEIYNKPDEYPYLLNAIQVKLHPINTWYFGTLKQRLDLNCYFTIIRRIFILILTPAGLVLFLVALFHKSSKIGFFLKIWLLSTVASILVVFNLNYVHEYYQLPLVPIISIFCGIGLNTMLDRMYKLKYLKFAIIIFLLSVFSIFSVMLFSRRLDYNFEKRIVEWGNFVEKVTDKDKMVAVCTFDNDTWDPTFLYFCDRKGYKLARNQLSQKILITL